MAVSERLASPGRTVHLVASHWRHTAPSGPVLDIFRRSARKNGVIIAEGSVSGAFGAGRVEAVVANGDVIKCEALIIVPERAPRAIPTGAELGPAGGLLVDGLLQTTARGTLAAGGCAEMQNGFGVTAVLDEDPGMSGRIAGANCTGGKIAARNVSFLRARAFGLKFATEGIGQMALNLWGSRFESVSRSCGSSACTIVYERPTGRVSSVQVVGPTEEDSLASVANAAGASLRSIAYGGLGSSDISLLVDTARLGLYNCRDY